MLVDLDKPAFWLIIRQTLSSKNYEEDEYTLKRRLRERGMMGTRTHGGVEWPSELQGEKE